MEETRLFRAEEVALLVGISTKTLNYWYMFKKDQPENEYSKLLPDYTIEKNTRYWREDDIEKLLEFSKSIPRGRNGIMGSITQKYWRNKRAENE